MDLIGNCTFAQQYTDANNVVHTENIVQLSCAPIIVQNLLHWAIFLVGAVALFLIIYAGFRFLTSGGEKEKVAEAQKTLTWALIGLITVLLSFAIIKFVAGITGVNCLANPFDFNSCAQKVTPGHSRGRG